MDDSLIKYREAGIGWALWNFRGPFGILDSERKDVQYEDFHGHKLDRKMLELLEKYK
jgi:endoglucanase